MTTGRLKRRTRHECRSGCSNRYARVVAIAGTRRIEPDCRCVRRRTGGGNAAGKRRGYGGQCNAVGDYSRV